MTNHHVLLHYTNMQILNLQSIRRGTIATPVVRSSLREVLEGSRGAR